MKKAKPNEKKKGAKMSNSDQSRIDRAALKQLHCEAVALHIVGKLIDCAVEEDVFLSTLRYLNQNHYQDVVEERAITEMCGYPICPNIIPDLPNQTYHISTKSNKIYDVTDRKNYCSNFCYTAGNYIKDQMMTSPLWYRDQETIPNFKLLKQPKKIQPGEEIDQGLIKIDPEIKPTFTSTAQLCQDFLSDVPDNYEEDRDIFKKENEEIVINKVKNSAKVNVMHNLPSTSSANGCTVTSESEVKVEEIDVIKPEKISLGDKSEVKKPIINPELSVTNEDFFYTKMFAPSLTDILSENKKYFEEVDNKLNVTNNENVPKIKGILSSKDKGKRRKSVTFHSDTKVEIKEDRIFKKPIPLKTVDDINVAHKRRITEDSLINKPVIEHKTIILPTLSEENRKKQEISESGSVFSKNSANNKKLVSEMSKETNLEITTDKFEQKNKEILTKSESIDLEYVEQKNLDKKDVKIAFTEDEEKTLNFTLTDKLKNSENNQNNQSTNKKPQNLVDLLTNIAIQTPKIVTEKHNSENMNTLLNKPVTEHVSLAQKIKDQSFDPLKETRKLGIKNSSTFTQAKLLASKFKSNKQENRNDRMLDVVIKKINQKENQPPLISDSSHKISDSVTKNNREKIKNTINVTVNQSMSDNFIVRLESCTKEWFTLETMVYLYGEDKVVNYVPDKTLKEHLNERKNTKEAQAKKKQYDEICKKINLMELHDRKYDKKVAASKKKPVPSYTELKERAETMDLRVQAFYSGCFEVIEMESEETKTDDENESEDIQGAPAVLPLVENKDFFPLRKKVFLSSLGRTVQKLCQIFDVPQNILITDLRELVDTFTFDSKNIIFKTVEWPIVTIFLIKLLGFKKKQYAEILELKQSKDYITSVTGSVFKEDVNDFILKLSDSYLNMYGKRQIEE